MKNQFVTFELAVKLKELGFDEECLASFIELSSGDTYLLVGEMNSRVMEDLNNQFKTNKFKVLAPLWSQVFDWFREKHNYHYEIFLTSDSPYDKFHYRVMEIGKYFTLSYDDFEGTYEEAREVCLEKLIELIS